MNAISADQIKADSEKWILDAGGSVLNSLPHIGIEELKLRSKEEIAKRALVLNVLIHMSYGAPPQFCKDWLSRHNLLDAVSSQELSAINNPGSLDEKIKSGLRWNIEALLAAAWLGAFYDDFTPIGDIPDSLASFFPDLRQSGPLDEFFDSFTLRTMDEIYPVLDLHYRANWHTVNCRLTGKDSGDFHPGIVYERRKMLEWATHAGCDWDEVEMST